MRKSGFLVLLLTALLVILPVVAFAAEADNSSFELSLETKIGIEEEVARLGENVTALAVDTQPVGIATHTLITAHSAHTGLTNNDQPVQANGGGDALRGSP